MVAHLLIFGLGYSGAAVAAAASGAGWQVTATSRTPESRTAPPGVALIGFDGAAAALAGATHLLSTAAPGPDGDPVLARFGDAVHAAPLRWLGYLSTTGVYGDRGGAWVDEATEPAPHSERGRRRVAAERAWAAAAAGRPLDLVRLAGIYGPGRSVLDDVRAGKARRVAKPGHAFGRIHRDDIAGAVLAAALSPPEGIRVLNGTDDEPAESADVIAYAAGLLGRPVPDLVPYEQAVPGMSAMARSFWADNRKVSSRATQRALGRPWRYPTYREGLGAILAAEQGRGQQVQDGPA